MTHICVMSSHKPIRIYMGVLILGVNTLYRLFCFFKLFLMVGKGLKAAVDSYLTVEDHDAVVKVVVLHCGGGVQQGKGTVRSAVERCMTLTFCANDNKTVECMEISYLLWKALLVPL